MQVQLYEDGVHGKHWTDKECSIVVRFGFRYRISLDFMLFCNQTFSNLLLELHTMQTISLYHNILCWLLWNACIIHISSGFAGTFPLDQLLKQKQRSVRILGLSSLSLSSSSSSNNEEEKEGFDVDIDWLVMSLAMEQDDDSRRKKLANVFEKRALEKGFADSFLKSLEITGASIQQSAREKAEARQIEKEENDLDKSDSEEDDLPAGVSVEKDGSIILPDKTAEELQLWAIVDMMVQSKLILKKIGK